MAWSRFTCIGLLLLLLSLLICKSKNNKDCMNLAMKAFFFLTTSACSLYMYILNDIKNATNYILVSHNNPCFQYNIANTNFLVSHTWLFDACICIETFIINIHLKKHDFDNVFYLKGHSTA